MHPILLAIIAQGWAYATSAAAAATKPAPVLAPVRYLNGQPMNGGTSPAAATQGQPCTADQDAMECAASIAKTFELPVSSQGETSKIQVPFVMGGFDGWINPEVYVVASECKLSDPTIASKGTLFFCNSETCKQSFSFTSSQTNTHTYSYKVSFQLSASGGFLKFFTVTATAGTEWNEGWNSSETNTTTTTREFDMTNGQVCAPTTVEFSVTCSNTLRLADTSVQTWQWYYDNRAIDAYLKCDELDLYRNTKDCDPTGLAEFCDAVQNNKTIVTTMQVSQPGVVDEPWKLEGCMYQ